MNLNDYYSKLERSKEYKDFIKKNPKTYLCSCFFMIDRENNTNKVHFDYFIDEEKKGKQNAPPTSAPLPLQPPKIVDRSKKFASNVNDVGLDNENKKMFSFKINADTNEITISPTEFFDKRIPEKLNLDKKIELEIFEKLIVEKMKKENISESIKKFLYSFQCMNGKNLLLATIFLSKLALLKVSIDISKMEIIDFEKKSFFDIISFVKK